MKFYFMVFTVFFLGCVETIELSYTQEKVTENQIKDNKQDALKAKESYLKLQRQRVDEGSI